MYFFLAAVSTCFAYWLYAPGFLDMPLGQITLRMLFSQVLFLLALFAALAFFAASLEKDPFWPWHEKFRVVMRHLRTFTRR
jgi:hypothetical protein